MAGDDEILRVKAKPKLVKSASASRTKTGGPYKNNIKRPTSGKSSVNKSRSARELWLETVKSGDGAMSSGRKPGQHPGKRTPTEYWMDTLRKTGEGHSTESTAMNSLSGTKRLPDGSMPYLSTSHYLRQMTGVEKTPRKTPDLNSRPAPGTPAYKSQEEYYEEILLLRKQISALNSDHSLMKSKLRRTEEENTKKEKEIEKLLDPSKSEEMRRTLADRKPDAGMVIHGLKQKIVRLEQQLKENEAAHKKLQSDVKVTRVDEMKVQLEAFYTEIVRLQQGGHVQKKGKSDTPVKESKETSAKVRALNETILKINDTNTRLREENITLKQDLDKRIEESQIDTVDGAPKEYVDMSKRQLIGLVVKLEKKIEKMDYDNVSLLSDMDKRRDGKVEGKVVLSGSLNDRIDQLDKRETELLQERERLQESLKKTKDDRAYNRKKCEELEKEVKELKKETQKYRGEADVFDGMSRKSLKQSSRHSVTSEMSNRPALALEDAERERDRKIEEFQKQRAAKIMQRSWKKRQGGRTGVEDDEAASLIQSTLRGHQTRKDRANQLRKHLDRPDSRGPLETDRSRGAYDMESVATDDASVDDDVITIQSAFRGHMGRKDGRRRQSQSPTPKKRPNSAKPSKRVNNDLDSEGESLEEDSILSRGTTPPTSSRTKRPSSGSTRDYGSSGVFSSPRRKSPALREMDEDEDDDDIVY